MLQAYIDESGRGQGDLLVLAGYIAPSEVWAEKFVPEWDRLLKLGPPKHRNIDAFKMRDMLGQPEQSSWFYRVIEESVVAEVSCVLSLSELYAAYREFPWPFRFADNSLFTNPYYMGFQAIMTLMAQFQTKLRLDEPIDFIFDETTEKANCMIAWDGMKQFGPAKVGEMLGDSPIFRSDSKVLPLQAADMLAYWAREWSYQGVLGDLDKMNFPWERRRKIPGAAFRLTKETFLAEFETRCKGDALDRIFKANKGNKVRQAFFGGSTISMPEPANKTAKHVPLVNKQNVLPVYSNSVTTNFTMFDIRLLFGEIIPDGNGDAEHQLRAHVVLTPAHARSLAALLLGAVEHYEQEFGKVEQPNPPKVQPN